MSPVGDAYAKPGLAPAADRLEMCRLACRSSGLAMVDGWEADQPGYTRTLAVLRHVQRRLEELMAPAAGEGEAEKAGEGNGERRAEATAAAEGSSTEEVAAAAAAAESSYYVGWGAGVGFGWVDGGSGGSAAREGGKHMHNWHGACRLSGAREGVGRRGQPCCSSHVKPGCDTTPRALLWQLACLPPSCPQLACLPPPLPPIGMLAPLLSPMTTCRQCHVHRASLSNSSSTRMRGTGAGAPFLRAARQRAALQLSKAVTPPGTSTGEPQRRPPLAPRRARPDSPR